MNKSSLNPQQNGQNIQVIEHLIVVVPAAGVGKRMQAVCPKQYLLINEQSVLSHTVKRLLSHPKIDKVVLSLSADDQYFKETSLATNPQVIPVTGGKERVDSVLRGLKAVDEHSYPWVMVHDAARPCISHQDIDALIDSCQQYKVGGILATPVRDTMKRSSQTGIKHVTATVDRTTLWHALTPQMYPTKQLIIAIESAQKNQQVLTDESSAIEYMGDKSLLIAASSDNIKITRQDDLALAEFILAKQSCKQGIKQSTNKREIT